MENDNRLVYIDEEGNEVLCEILFTFDSEEFNKSYVLFYPVGDEEAEEIEVLAASYVPLEDGTVGELNDIESEEEWQLIEETLNAFDTDDEEHECHCHDGECDCDEDCDCEK
ncbi:MAG: DUF1292 domain-containing protein [Bacilli bacterium]